MDCKTGKRFPVFFMDGTNVNYCFSFLKIVINKYFLYQVNHIYLLKLFFE